MRNFFRFTAFTLMLCTLVGLGSCSEGEGENGGTSDVSAAIVGRWEIADASAKYGSFEFTGDGKYIITQRVAATAQGAMRKSTDEAQGYIIVLFGDIADLKDNGNSSYSLTLKNIPTLGDVSITISISGTSAEITISNETYAVEKVEEVASDSKTDLLCHTWTFQKCEIVESLVSEEKKQYYISEYGADWKAKVEQEYAADLKGATVTFTKAGTYLVNNPQDEEFSNTLHYWKWQDVDKGILNYKHGDDAEFYADSPVTIQVARTSLVVQEREYKMAFVRE